MVIELRVVKDPLENIVGVTEPNLVFSNLPFGWGGGSRWRVVVAQGKRFPGNIPECDGINLA
jgi:hypothetical protein